MAGSDETVTEPKTKGEGTGAEVCTGHLWKTCALC